MQELLTGNEAIARGAYEYGVHCATAYPGTPSTEILENVIRYKEIYSEWSPNEKVAYEVAYGAAVSGGRSLVAMKHVGLNVAADPFMTSAYTGITSGLVVVSADDPSQHSSQNEQDNRRFAFFGKVPCLEPADSQEAKDFVGEALTISEKFDIPVMLRVTTRISHSKSLVALKERVEIPPREYVKNPEKYLTIPAYSRVRRVDLERRLGELRTFSNEYAWNKIEMRSTEMGIITSGIVYQYCREAFPEASTLKIALCNPLPDRLIREFAGSVKTLYVVEELEPYMEEQIRAMGISMIGKELIPSIGELSSDIVRNAIEKRPVEKIEIPEIPVRPPVLCPSCPHRGFFTVVNKMKLVSLGDIGCYTLGALPPLNAMDSCVCMGGSIGMAIGFSKIHQKLQKKTIGVIGDSTFIHSGITGLIDAVYNKANVVVCILDNATTAMTGHQEHPATGKTISGEATAQLDLEKLCEAVGVKHLKVVDPLNLKDTEEALKAALEFDGPAVLIFRAPCIIKYREAWKTPKAVDKEKCIKCGLCMRIGCPAIIKDRDGKAEINLTLCIGCGVCQQVCKKEAIASVKK